MPETPVTHDSQEGFDKAASHAVSLLSKGQASEAEAAFKLAQLFWMDLVLEKLGLLVSTASMTDFHSVGEGSNPLQPSIEKEGES